MSWHEAYRGWHSIPMRGRRSCSRLTSSIVQACRGRGEQLKALEVPTLLVIGDADIVRPEHTVEMFRLLGGGLSLDTGEPSKTQLAILPGTTHEGVWNASGGSPR
jgi:pimeloyl-ACP methyl ester carboxylesterase